MRWARLFLTLSLLTLLLSIVGVLAVHAGQTTSSDYRVLSPLISGNLTVFPIVARDEHNTAMFLTLDEGLRSGEVVVTEAGAVQPLIRGPHPQHLPRGNAQVNTLMLINNSKRPLLLLAGEIVTGGKQDRVIGKDRIVPAESEPIDLGVFCVEPGRWVARTDNFGGFGGLAQPNVRAQAMAKKDQQEVWNAVRNSQAKATETVTVEAQSAPIVAGGPVAAPSPAIAELNRTTSYAQVMDNSEVKKQMDKIVEPIQHSYESLLRDLRAKNAVGVVVAVNGEILWADIFASPDLLERYWPKLIRSYAAEAMTQGERGGKVSEAEALRFLDQRNIRHETAETDPGVYRHAELTGPEVKVFELTSLLPKTNFAVHTAIMHDETVAWKVEPRPLVRR
jgi:hypothetical protein